MRVWTQRQTAAPADEDDELQREPRAPWRVRRRYPHEALVFDTETEPGPAQRFRFLVWRYFRDDPDSEPARFLVEEGIAYADDLPQREPDGFQGLSEFAVQRETAAEAGLTTPDGGRLIEFKPLSWWLERRLCLYGYRHSNRCALIGFNLGFDFGRLCADWGSAGGRYRGGFSLGIWGGFDERGKWHDRWGRPRIRLKSIDPRRTLFGWGYLPPGQHEGPPSQDRFVDLRMLSFALTDRSYTLEGACTAFGDPYEKKDVSFETITPELIEYACEDVEHTATLYRNCLVELSRHEGIGLEPHRLYSPATVGVNYLEAMGVRRPLEKFTALTEQQLGWTSSGPHALPEQETVGPIESEVLGWAMSAFFGGRAEARIVRTPVPIAYVDFNSMYPAVNALLDTWALLRAERIETQDVTEAVGDLLADPTLVERCLQKPLWQQVGVTLVEVEPQGEMLPARCDYDPESNDFGIGINPLRYDGSLWYALPDVIAAAILSSPPKVKRAIHLQPIGTQDGLQPVRLRGRRQINPDEDDPFVAMVNERHRVRQDPNLEEEERKRLQQFLKITANATAYGTLARFDRRDLATPAPIDMYGPDGHTPAEPLKTPEDPGPYCFPPIAASITAGARLMLALLERLVTAAGGSYAFCDTDSMAIIASPERQTIPCQTADGRDHVLSLPWDEVRAILERFDALNPYDPQLVPSPWKEVAASLTEPLSCYAISAKRYCLYRTGPDGQPVIVAALDQAEEVGDDSGGQTDQDLEDWSEHGLGLYLDPTTEDQDRPRRDDQGRRIWVREAWQWILNDALADGGPMPAWAQAYALTRFTVSGPKTANWFNAYNNAQPTRSDWIAPGSFGLIAHPHPTFTEHTTTLPTAPYESEPEKWAALPWYDRRNGQPINILTAANRDDPERFTHQVSRGDPVIRILADIVARYRDRPEHKSRAPTADPGHHTTKGLLRRRPIESGAPITELIGKEGNQLAERLTGETTDPTDYRDDYGQRADRWTLLVLPVLDELGAARLIQQTDLGAAGIYEVLNRTTRHPYNRTLYEDAAIHHARKMLDALSIKPPPNQWVLLWRYNQERTVRGCDVRRCQWCGRPLAANARADARYDTDSCRQAARRARQP